MPTYHAAVAALPTGAAAEKTLLRNLLTARMPYVLADADDVTGMYGVDPDTGAAIIDFLHLGRVFHYDATDTLTPHDGTTCLVSLDNRRYKLADGSAVFAYSVLDRDLSAPPVSPTIGDAYLVAAGATGAWAGHSNQVAVYTIRGWEFVDFGIGRMLYAEDIDSYYHKNAAGAWVAGFGTQTLPANSVPLSAAINFGKRFIVENQTTTAPPASPTVGTAYIIGPSATGAWAGHDAKVAICEVAGSFVIYTPGNGWEAYDKAQNNAHHFNGTAWVSSAGALLRYKRSYVEASTNLSADFGSSYYTYSAGTPPTTSNFGKTCSNTLAYAAHSTANLLRFKIAAVPVYSYTAGSSTEKPVTIALYVDGLAAASYWMPIANSADAPPTLDAEFYYTPPDTSSHTYTIRIHHGQGTNYSDIHINSLSRNSFSVEELVPS